MKRFMMLEETRYTLTLNIQKSMINFFTTKAQRVTNHHARSLLFTKDTCQKNDVESDNLACGKVLWDPQSLWYIDLLKYGHYLLGPYLLCTLVIEDKNNMEVYSCSLQAMVTDLAGKQVLS